MGIIPRFTQADVARMTQNTEISIESGIITALKYAGEEFVTAARNALKIDGGKFRKGDYTDRSHLLRKSIGFLILDNGSILIESFPDGMPEGIAKGRALALSVAKPGYQLVGVAGMEYASDVEARGYNVITSQADIALIDIPIKLRQLTKKLSKKGINLTMADLSDVATTAFR